ncbi:hypothetical protein EJ06DRAFT_584175 [Trichodelitschia bisporula]|uniref:RRM domain-containing protein n=1 Tax=Trichodelitschia bisporula TaxID=703511 RepID=A0A6G1HPG7_9PEZI|nr:hypothetical protein EJ06DRAFT_584175 [Trichodelitschia bisporula]
MADQETSPMENGQALAPLSIPQPKGPQPSVMSPGAMVAARRAAPEPNKRALYVGGLNPGVSDGLLHTIFEVHGHVQGVKIIPDKNYKNTGMNYGFVEFDDPANAQRAMETLHGRVVMGSEIKVNWAYQNNNQQREDTSGHFHLFVGDLSNEVNDEALFQFFGAWGSVSEARVMWDMKTGRSRGYGFVAYRERADAERAIEATQSNAWLGSRAIRVNWANQKGQPSVGQHSAMSQLGMSPFQQHSPFPTGGANELQQIMMQSPEDVSTVYVGNLTPYTTIQDLQPLFSQYGMVVENRFQADRGFAFMKLDSHQAAAQAICALNGHSVHGRPIKCSWGKERTPVHQQQPTPVYAHPPEQANFNHGYPPSAPNSAYPPTPTGYPYPVQYNPMSPAASSPANYHPQTPGYGPPANYQNFVRPQQGANQWGHAAQNQQHYAYGNYQG